MTASDNPMVSVTTRSCSDRRHAKLSALLSVPRPRSMGAERLRMRRLDPQITGVRPCTPLLER